MQEDGRLVKIVLPLQTIRQMDELLVSGLGGYESRAQLIRDAIESFVLELRYSEAPAEPTARRSPATTAAAAQLPQALDWSQTALHPPTEMTVIKDGEATVPDEPLFGLHNRDYPSLWIAAELAAASASGPVHLDAFMSRTIQRAWAFAEPYAAAGTPGLKPAALFPANREKKQASEQAFRMFAFGTITRSKEAGLRASGALFQWRVCQAVTDDKAIRVGLTDAGVALLRSLAGISMELPHERRLGTAFIAHLRQHGRSDLAALISVLRVVETRPTRSELFARVHGLYPKWTKVQAATNAAGYVARGREWGLIEPRMRETRYTITAFGTEVLEETGTL